MLKDHAALLPAILALNGLNQPAGEKNSLLNKESPSTIRGSKHRWRKNTASKIKPMLSDKKIISYKQAGSIAKKLADKKELVEAIGGKFIACRRNPPGNLKGGISSTKIMEK